MTDQVAVYRKSTGAFVHITSPKFAPAANDSTFGFSAMPDGYEDGIWIWDTTAKTFVADPAKVEAQLLAAVKAESERRTMLLYTPNRGKMREYSKKAQEVIDFRALGSEGAVSTLLNTVFMGLSASTKKRKFIYAQADAAKRGDTVADAITRFEAGMSNSETTVANLKATEAAACAAIRAATTAAAKRAAFAAINWAWAAP